jgi:hypothetical protein
VLDIPQAMQAQGGNLRHRSETLAIISAIWCVMIPLPSLVIPAQAGTQGLEPFCSGSPCAGMTKKGRGMKRGNGDDANEVG